MKGTSFRCLVYLLPRRTRDEYASEFRSQKVSNHLLSPQ